MRTRFPFLALLALVALAVAGCGGSGTAQNASHTAGPYGGSAQPAPKPATGAATVTTAKGALGTFLVDGRGRTLYLWEADKGGASTCSGACAQAWPPLTTTGAPKAGTGVTATWLGTAKRSDGTTQVTFKGHPLYTFTGDAKPGDTTGQDSDGFGAAWYVLGTNGDAIETD